MNEYQQSTELQTLDTAYLVEDNYIKMKKPPSTISIDIDSSSKAELCKKRVISRLKIAWSFMSFLISAVDVYIILLLSYLHFIHSQAILAWIMLLPILLNFIGIFTFLSNETERKEMESLGCQKIKHLMHFPVIGPTFSALRLFFFAFQEKNTEKFERLESLLMKMKQYESFFRAAPEAFIQITFRIANWSNTAHWHCEDYITSICIGLCLFTLAESNIYAAVLPAYYRLFNYSLVDDAWKTNLITISWRIGLFFFNYLSIGSRLMADAIFRATACFYYTNLEFGEVIVLTFIVQFIARAIFHAIYQNTFLQLKKSPKLVENSKSMAADVNSNTTTTTTVADEKNPPRQKPHINVYLPVQEDLTGVYGAFTYSWRCLFMSFDFQDWGDKMVFFWFYVENLLLIGSSYAVIYYINYDLSDKKIYYLYLIVSFVDMILAILLKYTLVYCWKRKEAKKGKVVPSRLVYE